MTKRTRIVIPAQLANQIDTIVEKREELMRLRQIKALEAAAGSWKDKDHPELKGGAAKWVEQLRRQDEKRFQKVTTR